MLIGDGIEKIAKATGVKRVVDRISKATGKDCGCNKRKKERKKKINEWQLKNFKRKEQQR